MMVPFEMLIITNYSTMVRLRLMDTHSPLLALYHKYFLYVYLAELLLGHTGQPVLLRPGRWSQQLRYLWRIMVPMAKPALATIGASKRHCQLELHFCGR